MKTKPLFFAVLMAVFTAFSCEKTTCATCSVVTNGPAPSSSKTYCGTDYEISKENTRLKNDCETMRQSYPQYTFDCGCE